MNAQTIIITASFCVLATSPHIAPPTTLVDAFGRRIDYARLSVTDRCDFRCVYCMPETMQFLPRDQILSLEELYAVAVGLVHSGIRKIRLTGGEPLVRNNIIWLVEKLGALAGLEELTLTTNGSQLVKHAPALAANGVRRINISIDSLNADKFRRITRTGDLQTVIDGIDAAIEAGFEQIKLNSVIMKYRNDDEIVELVEFAASREIDIAFIEEMPLGSIDEHDRALAFCSSDEVKQRIEAKYTLIPSAKKTSGPSRYYQLVNNDGHSDTHVGFISPHSNNFCGECNRIRVTVEGRLLLCLGNEHSVDLRGLLRERGADHQALADAITQSMQAKPERHHFNHAGEPEIVRFMNMTGG